MLSLDRSPSHWGKTVSLVCMCDMIAFSVSSLYVRPAHRNPSGRDLSLDISFCFRSSRFFSFLLFDLGIIKNAVFVLFRLVLFTFFSFPPSTAVFLDSCILLHFLFLPISFSLFLGGRLPLVHHLEYGIKSIE